MPITIAWLDHTQHILLETLEGLWSLEDYATVVASSLEMIGNTQERVDYISDVSNATISGSVLLSMPKIFKTTAPRHELNVGSHIIVGGSPMVEHMVGIYHNIFERRDYLLTTAPTIDAALELIRSDRLFV